MRALLSPASVEGQSRHPAIREREVNMASIEKRQLSGTTVWRAHYRTPAGAQQQDLRAPSRHLRAFNEGSGQ